MEQFAVVLSYEICRCRNENFGNSKYMCKFVRVSCFLVFYNIRLPTYIVVELKRTPIKPQYMGQLNFYIFVVDDTLRGEHDNKTIGLLLCNGGDKVVAQYAFSGYELRIGVSGYQLTKAILDNLRSTLPPASKRLRRNCRKL